MKKKGRGLATIMFGFGYGEGFPDYSEASIEIKDDGQLLIRTAAADVGQGVETVVTQIAAEVLNTNTSQFSIVEGDTHTTKNSGSTSATRQTYFTGNAVKNAAQDLLGKIYFFASKEFGTNYPEMTVKEGYAYPVGEEDKKLSFREIAYRVQEKGEELKGEGTFYPETYDYDENGQSPKTYVAYTFMTQIYEVEVDTDTGLVDVLDVKTALDVGKAINPKNVEGQIEGGTTQGIGMALMEEQVIENYQTFIGYKDDAESRKKEKQGKSNLHIPKTYEILDTIRARILTTFFNKRPYIEFEPMPSAADLSKKILNEEKADVAASFVDEQLEKNNIKSVFYRVWP